HPSASGSIRTNLPVPDIMRRTMAAKLEAEAAEAERDRQRKRIDHAIAVGSNLRPPPWLKAKPATEKPTKPSSKPPAPVKRWRKPPPQKDIKAALGNILKTEPTLSGEKLENALCNRLGEGMTRQRAREAIRQYAADTIRPRGRPRKNNSPK